MRHHFEDTFNMNILNLKNPQKSTLQVLGARETQNF